MSIADDAGAARSVRAAGFSADDLGAIEQSVAAAGGRFLHDDGASADVAMVESSDREHLPLISEQTAGARHLILRGSLDTVDDLVEAWPDAEIVIGRDPVDLHLAVASALKRAETGMTATFDVATEEGFRLQRLAEEIGRIARTLVELPEGLSTAGLSGRAARSEFPDEEPQPSDAPVTAAEVRAIIRLRRLRDRYFPAELFADPAWDMLLDLAAARLERVSVAVSSLCIAAAVPPTTALRWIKAMTEKGLLRRIADQHDARRIFIRLSDDAAAAMEKYLRAARSNGGMAV